MAGRIQGFDETQGGAAQQYRQRALLQFRQRCHEHRRVGTDLLARRGHLADLAGTQQGPRRERQGHLRDAAVRDAAPLDEPAHDPRAACGQRHGGRVHERTEVLLLRGEVPDEHDTSTVDRRQVRLHRLGRGRSRGAAGRTPVASSVPVLVLAHGSEARRATTGGDTPFHAPDAGMPAGTGRVTPAIAGGRRF
ncbi:hypothetical protein [Streptomyces sp. SJL17-4]|uniref:hypothetical protein n=1 Tax=Streptomyces sp. SJL17-4 TaxID=2967224 RepID=UPI0030D27CA9